MWALVPLKYLAKAKQRLAGFLTPGERHGLCRAMVDDVLTTLTQSTELAGVLLVSPDPSVESLAERFGCDYLQEAELGVAGLNAVVEAAVARLAAKGIDGVMIVHGDLPLFRGSELSRLLRVHTGSPGPAMTIAPDRHGMGSNCIVCGTASRLTYCFGPDSFRRHVAQARAKGMTVNVERLPGVALDIDTRDDLGRLLADMQSEGHTQRYLESIGCGVPSSTAATALPNSLPKSTPATPTPIQSE